MSQRSAVNIVLKQKPPEIWVIIVLSLQQMLCVVTMHVITTSFRTNCVVFKKNPGFT